MTGPDRTAAQSARPPDGPAGAVVRGKHDTIRMARSARLLLQVLTGGLVLLFGWLQFKDVDFGRLAHSASATVILKTALVLYFLSWAKGAKHDIDEQELAWVLPPSGGRIPWQAVLFCVLLGVVFAVLCWVSDVQRFALALAAFLLLNVAGWQFMVRRMLPGAIAGSLQQYARAEEYGHLECGRLVRDYLCGAWQWRRFALGLVLIGAINVLAFGTLGAWCADRLHMAHDAFVAGAILLYVLVMEAWVWRERFRLDIGLQLIQQLGASYRFSALETSREASSRPSRQT